jgi:hypothetical protein
MVDNCSSDAEKNEFIQRVGWITEWKGNIRTAVICMMINIEINVMKIGRGDVKCIKSCRFKMRNIVVRS